MFHATMTFYQNLDFPYNFLDRNEIMLQILIRIDLNSQAKLHENPVKMLRKRTI